MKAAFNAYAKFYEPSMKLLAYRAHDMLVSALVAVHESRKEHVSASPLLKMKENMNILTGL